MSRLRWERAPVARFTGRRSTTLVTALDFLARISLAIRVTQSGAALRIFLPEEPGALPTYLTPGNDDWTYGGSHAAAWRAGGPSEDCTSARAFAAEGEALSAPAYELGALLLDRRACDLLEVSASVSRPARIEVDVPPRLRGYAWELARARRFGYFACAESLTFVRSHGTRAPPAEREAPALCRVLGAFASPQGYPPLDVERESDALRRAIGGAIGFAKPRELGRAQWHVLARQLAPSERAEPTHVLHFGGHGDPHGALVLSGPSGAGVPIPADRVVQCLADAKELRLVVLHACYGDAGAAQPFGSLAEQLVEGGVVRAVVALSTPLPDADAPEATFHLYRALAKPSSIDVAVQSVRRELCKAGARSWPFLTLQCTGAPEMLATAPHAQADRATIHSLDYHPQDSVLRRAAPPQVIVLPGPADSGHDHVAERAVWHALGRIVRSTAQLELGDVLAVPQLAPSWLLGELARLFDLDGAGAPDAALATVRAALRERCQDEGSVLISVARRPIAVERSALAGAWGKLIKDLIGPESLPLVVLLGLRWKSEPRPNAHLKSWTEALERELGEVPLVVAPDLPRTIGRDEILTFVRDRLGLPERNALAIQEDLEGSSSARIVSSLAEMIHKKVHHAG